MSFALNRNDETLREPRFGASDVSVILPADFRLESGEMLARPEIRLRLCGAADGPAIVVAGGISAGRAAADNEGEKGWWRNVVKPGGAIDTARFRVIAFDFLPNPGETAGTLTTGDQARALAFALDKIGVLRLHAFAGASYGGMVALNFAALFSRRTERLIVISAADRAHPAATAVRGVQRRIVEFARSHGDGAAGVALARQLAMTTYRTPEEFAERFSNGVSAAAGDPYPVCNYLIARGDAYDMASSRYVALSDSIDRHRVDPAAIATPALIVAVASDRLVPPGDSRRLAGAIAGARYFEFDSRFGHDAFLKEEAVIGPVVKSFIEENHHD